MVRSKRKRALGSHARQQVRELLVRHERIYLQMLYCSNPDHRAAVGRMLEMAEWDHGDYITEVIAHAWGLRD